MALSLAWTLTASPSASQDHDASVPDTKHKSVYHVQKQSNTALRELLNLSNYHLGWNVIACPDVV
jgi:hypothetical protein